MTSENTPIVTVVIPVFRSAGTLKRAIDSVLAQSLTDLELLVIDDASPDDSLAVATAAAAKDSRIVVIPLTQNGGKSRAMNYAASIARGQWLAVLDADDRYLPSRLATLVAAGEAHGVDMVADNQIHSDNATGQVHRYAFAAEGVGRAIGLADFIAHSNPAAPFDFGILKPMLRTDFIKHSGLAYHPDAKLAEDFYFMMDFFTIGGRGWLVHEALYEWTLPFSPTSRRWTATGNGAWRYDYRNAQQVNTDFQRKEHVVARPELVALLDKRAREYKVMIAYLDAQREAAEGRGLLGAAFIIVSHPHTWPLLARRVFGRLRRSFGRSTSSSSKTP